MSTPDRHIPRVAGIVLAGGKSSRMGRPKLSLPFGPELMLQRVVRLLGDVVSPIVVVAAPAQEIPPLPNGVEIVRDRRESQGPLEGLAAGLTALTGRADVAYATSCDVPLLAPGFVRRVVELLGDAQASVPFVDGFHHPLAAAYRIEVLPRVERLLAAGRMRPVFLFDEVPTRIITADELRDADPDLGTLKNCNRPEDYETALALAGFAPPNDAT